MSKLILILGGILRELRCSTGDTQVVVSEKTGLSPSYISELENGKRRVTLSVLEKYATAYDVAASSLMARAEPPRVEFAHPPDNLNKDHRSAESLLLGSEIA